MRINAPKQQSYSIQREVVRLNTDRFFSFPEAVSKSHPSSFFKEANAKLTIKDLNKKEVYKALSDSDTYATVLLAICLVSYGEETFKVDPLTLYQWLKEDYGAILSEASENKLNALLVSMTSDKFYTDLDVFKSVCKTLTDGDPGVYDPNFDDPTLIEILWGIYEVSLNTDKSVNDKFAPVIEQFIQSASENEVNDFIGTTEDLGIAEREEGEIANESNITATGSSSVSLSPEQTYTEVIMDNVAAMKMQLREIGIKDIPTFPVLEV